MFVTFGKISGGTQKIRLDLGRVKTSDKAETVLCTAMNHYSTDQTII